jgi:deoxyribose-phosphate aldolase
MATENLVSLHQVKKMIDHSILKPDFTTEEVKSGCELARKYDVASVCVRPCDVPIAAEILKGSDVVVSTVIGFPHGTTTTETKVFESKQAIASGAVELDMVLNISWLKSGRVDDVKADIAAVVNAAKEGGAIVKVIFENAYLTEEQKITACKISEEVGAAFVKTSTGYATTGSTPHDLKLMRANVSPAVRVKAAGGIRSLAAVLEARACGAVRCGATATQAIVEEFEKLDPTGKGLPLPSLSAPSTIGGSY